MNPRQALYATEAEIQASTILRLQKEWPDGLWYRRNVGSAPTGSGRWVKFGHAGQADITGMIAGRAIEIEVKRHDGRQSKPQKSWQAAVESAGGIYIIARSPDEAVEKIKEKISGGAG